MIRAYRKADLDRVMELWLDSNLKVHDFIDPDYWHQHEQLVRSRMPCAELYVFEEQGSIKVFEEQGSIKGFVGIEEGYIAGIFVDEQARSMGVGKALLAHCKKQYLSLSLHVYEKNHRAVCFYQREGFEIVENQIEEKTQEHEYFMTWKKNQDGNDI